MKSLKQFVGYLRMFNDDIGWGAHWKLIENNVDAMLESDVDMPDEARAALVKMRSAAVEIEEGRKEFIEAARGYTPNN